MTAAEGRYDLLIPALHAYVKQEVMLCNNEIDMLDQSEIILYYDLSIGSLQWNLFSGIY